MEIYSYFICLPLLLISAFSFNAAEAGFFTLTAADIEEIRKRGDATSRKIVFLLEQPRRLFLTTVTGFVISLVLATLCTVLLARRFAYLQSSSTAFATLFGCVAVVVLILLFGEVLPKLTAQAKPEQTVRLFAIPIWLAFHILSPVTVVFGWLSMGVAKSLDIERERFPISTTKLESLIESDEPSPAINASEREMIRAVIEFRETSAREIMVPRIEIVAIQMDLPVDEAIQKARESGHSRIPVYDGTIDKIIGILYTKDLLGDFAPDTALRTLVRPAYFVPENKHLNELLREFQLRRLHLAVVVDEYGSTAGVVTLEDILEEIIGEIQDEYDREAPPLQQVGDAVWLAQARTQVADLNETVGEPVVPEGEDYYSLGGYLCDIAGRVPEPGESFRQGNWQFTVEKRIGNRIVTVRLQRVPEADEEGDVSA